MSGTLQPMPHRHFAALRVPMRLDIAEGLLAAWGDESVPRTLRLERALALLASRQHGTISRAQLLALGFQPGEIQTRISCGRLIPLHRGVYAVGHSAISRDGRWLAATLATGAESALSFRDSSAAWSMGDFTFRTAIEVTLPGTGSRQIEGIRVHRSRDLSHAHVTELRGIRVTTPAWTLRDLAGTLGARHFRQCFDAADRLGVLDWDELAYLIDNGRGHRGVSLLARYAQLDRRQARRTRSMLELDFLAFCREEGFPEPLVNHTFESFEVDACWPKARLVVELDSWEWHRGRAAFERDRAKSSDLQAAGLHVIPVTDQRLRQERPRVADTIGTLLARADAA